VVEESSLKPYWENPPYGILEGEEETYAGSGGSLPRSSKGRIQRKPIDLPMARLFSTRCSSAAQKIFHLIPTRASVLMTSGTRSIVRRLDLAGPSYAADFQSPIVFPSGSAIHAKVPVGIVTGPTSFLQPSASALAMCAATSSTAT